MGLRSGGVVRGVSGISRTEGRSRGPALLRENAVAEAGGVVGPGSVLWVVRDARTALPVTLAKLWAHGEREASHTSSVPRDPS